jgi:hypothetical protein
MYQPTASIFRPCDPEAIVLQSLGDDFDQVHHVQWATFNLLGAVFQAY